MNVRAYTAYQASDIPWMLRIPSTWRIERAKRLFALRKVIAGRDDLPLLSVTQRGIRPRDISTHDGQLADDYSKYQLVDEGDFVMNAMDLLTGFVDQSPTQGITSPDYRVFRLREGAPITAEYLLLQMQSGYHNRHYYHLGQGASHFGRWRLPTEALLNLPFSIPSLDEQKAIASFVRRETAKIDALIAEQERLIALLQEKRQAVISHAVTKGLDPNVPMKDSGVEWIGQIPTHWSTMPARRVVQRIEQGWSPQCHAFPAAEDEWGVLKAGCVNGGRYNETENKALPEELEVPSELEVQVGDLLMSRASGSPKLIGSVARVEATRRKLLLSDKIYRIRCTQDASSDWFALSFASRPVREQIEIAISGAEGLANNLPQSALLSIVLCVPPMNEQTRIVLATTGIVTEIVKLEAHASAAIALLRERRTALITAAVTGQIDVRGLVESAA